MALSLLHSSTPDSERGLDAQVGHMLRKAHQRATAIFLETAGNVGLTPPQYAALSRLAEMGELSQNRLGRLTAMDPATIQGVIRRLVDRNLVALRPDEADRRRLIVTLTEEGMRALDMIEPATRRINDRILAPLPPHEREILLRMLQRIAG